MRASLLVLLCVVLASSARAQPLPPQWRSVQTVQLARTGVVALSVPLETLDAARADLADLRLYDEAGREVPFRIERPGAASPTLGAARNFRVTLSADATVATFDGEPGRPVERVLLQTPASDFLKAASVEGSADAATWQPVARDQPVFRREGAARLFVDFAPAAWTHWRLTLDDRRTEPIPLTGASLEAADPAPPDAEPLELKVVDRDESAGQTRITLEAAGARATLAGIEIEAADPLFARRVTLAWRDYRDGEVHEGVLADDTIYRVALEGQPAAAGLRFAQGVTIPTRELILIVRNGDSPPLDVTAIRATRRPVFVVFLASRPGAVHLLSANPQCSAPRYDLAELAADVTAARAVPDRVLALAPNPAYEPAEPLAEIGDSGPAIDLADWRFRKPVDLAKPGVQELELDLGTLACSAPSFGDLRLVRGGRQIPYLLEHPSCLRSLTPAVEQADDPRRSGRSCWRIRLPLPALPLCELSCTTDAPLFRRILVVNEQVADERGELRTVTLGSAPWTRTPQRSHEPFTMTLSPPAGDLLTLETDNGDNPPLTLRDVVVRHRIWRLIFKAPADPPTILYYGNPRAQRPRYDLDLVAADLLAAPKSKAALGEAESLRKGRWASGDAWRAQAGWIFWGVLGLVVATLLYVLARLLPKGQQ